MTIKHDENEIPKKYDPNKFEVIDTYKDKKRGVKFYTKWKKFLNEGKLKSNLSND